MNIHAVIEAIPLTEAIRPGTVWVITRTVPDTPPVFLTHLTKRAGMPHFSKSTKYARPFGDLRIAGAWARHFAMHGGIPAEQLTVTALPSVDFTPPPPPPKRLRGLRMFFKPPKHQLRKEA